MIGIEIKKSGFAGQTPSGIVITGGGAKTIGITDAAKRTLAMPVRIAIPTNVKGIIDEIQEPSFATVIGLGYLWRRQLKYRHLYLLVFQCPTSF